MNRYIRQIEVIGEEGQKKLLKARVLVVGAGGLGSAVIAYLASAGVGKIGIVDGDTVEDSNLQRQIIHVGKIGMNKAKSAEEFVKKLNPDVEVVTYPFEITPQNVNEIIKDYDIVVGCPDSFRVRYILNDACALNKKPYVHGAVYAFEGEVGVFFGNPCYRCYLPIAPKDHGKGIIGSVAGVFGCLQATEVIKLITGYGEVLRGKILRIDLSSMEFLEISVKPMRMCPICSDKLKGIFEENYIGSCEVKRFE